MTIENSGKLGSKLVILTIVAVAICMVALVSGCNDDSADMAAQIQARGNRAPADSLPGGTSGAKAADKDAGQTSKPGAPGKPGLPGKPGEAPAAGVPGQEAEALPEGPEVEVLMKNLKAPYPRFSGAGYYNFDLEVTAKEAVEAKVWEVQTLDEEGKILGTQRQMMVFIKDRMKEFAFRGFYCSKMPSSVKLVYTGKDAVAIDGTAGQTHGGGKGAELGGGSGAAGGGKSGESGGKTEGGEKGADDGADEGGD